MPEILTRLEDIPKVGIAFIKIEIKKIQYKKTDIKRMVGILSDLYPKKMSSVEIIRNIRESEAI